MRVTKGEYSMVEIKNIELLLAPKVRYCDEKFIKKPPVDIPGAFAEDTVRVKFVDKYTLVGYLADAAPGKLRESVFNIKILESRIFARFMGEVFIDTVDKFKNIRKTVSDGKQLWEKFKNSLKGRAENEIKKELIKIKLPQKRNLEAEIQVAFIGFVWEFDKNVLTLFQFGDGYSFISDSNGEVKTYSGGTTFTVVEWKDGNVEVEITDSSNRNKIHKLQSPEKVIITSDGVFDSNFVRNLKNKKIDYIYKEVKNSVRKDDDKSVIIIETGRMETEKLETPKMGTNLTTKKNKKKLKVVLSTFGISLLVGVFLGFFMSHHFQKKIPTTIESKMMMNPPDSIYLSIMNEVVNKLGEEIELSVDDLGRNPLHYAAMNANLLFLQKIFPKIDSNKLAHFVNMKDHLGRTPLHYAVISGNLNVVEFLVKHKADVNARDHDGFSPFCLAIKYHYFPIAEFLMNQKGCDISCLGNKGMSLLHYLASYKISEKK